MRSAMNLRCVCTKLNTSEPCECSMPDPTYPEQTALDLAEIERLNAIDPDTDWWRHKMIAALIARVHELEAEAMVVDFAYGMGPGQPTIQRHAEGGYVWTYCAECGPDISVDEDGTCVMCGRDAVFYGREPRENDDEV